MPHVPWSEEGRHGGGDSWKPGLTIAMTIMIMMVTKTMVMMVTQGCKNAGQMRIYTFLAVCESHVMFDRR